MAGKYKKTTQPVSKSIPRRGPQRKAICRRSTQKEDVPAIRVDTLGTIKFKLKKGITVLEAQEDRDDFQNLWNQVFEKYIDVPGSPKLKQETEGLQIVEMLENIKAMVGVKEVEITLFEGIDGWSVTAYREAEYNWGWTVFEVGKILKILEKENFHLCTLFMHFLVHLSHIGFDFWYQGLMGEELFNMDERIGNALDEEDEEAANAIARDHNNYKYGEADKFERYLRAIKKPYAADTIEKKLQQYPRHTIAQIIRMGLPLIKQGKTINEYVMDHPVKQEYCYLPLDSQFNIIWDASDTLTTSTEECIDAMANEGVEDAYSYVEIKGDSIDFSPLRQPDTFIKDLQLFFDAAVGKLLKTKKYA